MADKPEERIDNTKILKVQVNDEMKKSFISYAMAVNVSRAIPDVRDGLKPVHRRILYSMSELGLTGDKPHRKCARIVGDVLGKYHPHGDGAIYMALVRLAQDFSIRCPLVDGHGNFGSVDGDPPAAQRYTEARLSKIAAEMLRDIDKETVDWYPNFDDSLEQPTVLPSRFPNLLVNGSDGIAVGMATNIPPHNLTEVIDGVVALIDNPDISVEELIEYVPAPDFPTGGLIMGRMGVHRAYMTGRGSVVIRARAEIEEYSARGAGTRQRIVVTELPYQVNKAELIKKIADMVKDKRIEGISDIREESDREGLRVVIEIKRDAQANVVLNTLYKHTDLQTSGGIIFLALVNSEPKILNLKEMLFYYLEHQKEVITRRTQYDLRKAEERRHIVDGLVIALSNIDRVIAIIKASRDKFEAAENLMAEFLLSDKQANAILEMRLQRLTSLEVESLKEELEALTAKIADLTDILATPSRVTDIVKAEIVEIRDKYGSPRKTELAVDYDEIDIGDLIDKEDVVISMTHFGYLKRLPVAEYHAQRRGGMGITAHKPKEEDFVENMFVTSTHDDLLFFTGFGRVYSIKAYEVPEAERTARGRAIVNLLQLSPGEKVSAVIPVKEGEVPGGCLMMATRGGLVKKTPFSEFESIRKVGKIAITLNEGDELISVQLVDPEDEILLAASSGKCIRFATQNVRPTGRGSMGVRSISLSDLDFVVDMAVIRPGAEQEVLTVSKHGYGKRSSIDDYRLQSRAGKGILAGRFTEQTGELVNLKLIDPDSDVMMIADNGIIIRTVAAGIPKISRATKGVIVMRLKGEGSVVCVAVVPKEEGAEPADTDGPETEPADTDAPPPSEPETPTDAHEDAPTDNAPDEPAETEQKE
ncbi:MAG: DNA gyrase subunit A [Clostridiales bacterium]|jgi:DNA gyrase subunit A|nr:DNA gyrase subunit A [Clostridiales bacterium]